MNSQNIACPICKKNISSLSDPKGHVRRCEKKVPVTKKVTQELPAKKEEVKINPIEQLFDRNINMMPVEEMKFDDEFVSEDECVIPCQTVTGEGEMVQVTSDDDDMVSVTRSESVYE
jgi:hypothetical protein